MSHRRELPTLCLYGDASVTCGHRDPMYRHNQTVEAIESSVRLYYLLEDGSDHFLGNLILSSKGETYWLILYVNLVTNSKTDHTRILTIA